VVWSIASQMMKANFATAQKARMFTTPIVFGCVQLA
jgi:hypothetical protein